MQAFVVWFIAAFVLVVAELMTGSLYLLVIGAGAAAGGALALAGAGFAAQLAGAAAVSVAGIAVLKVLRRGGGHKSGQGAVTLDAGQLVEVLECHADGALRVSYRGTQWDAVLEGGGAAAPGERLPIREMRGNTLVLRTPHHH
ncbi:MAG: NfeD family protein [Burkholderiales bacterium]|nr:NfeD family protein [Burkholderiales bacterium]